MGIQPECAKLLFWGGQFMVGGFKKKSYTALRVTTMLFIHLLGMLVVVETVRIHEKTKQNNLTFLKSQMHLKVCITSRR